MLNHTFYVRSLAAATEQSAATNWLLNTDGEESAASGDSQEGCIHYLDNFSVIISFAFCKYQKY